MHCRTMKQNKKYPTCIVRVLLYSYVHTLRVLYPYLPPSHARFSQISLDHAVEYDILRLYFLPVYEYSRFMIKSCQVSFHEIPHCHFVTSVLQRLSLRLQFVFSLECRLVSASTQQQQYYCAPTPSLAMIGGSIPNCCVSILNTPSDRLRRLVPPSVTRLAVVRLLYPVSGSRLNTRVTG